MGEKTPTPEGPPSTPVAAVEALVTVPGGAVVPVDNSPVVVDGGAALVDELVAEVLVVDTASCAGDISGAAARKNTISATGANRLTLRIGSKRVEPRRKQETRNRFVTTAGLHVRSLCLNVSGPVVAHRQSSAEAFATG